MSKKTVSAFTDKEAVRLDEQAEQINEFTPDQLQQEIEKTREHMDENLALLGKKLNPNRLRNLQVPLVLGFLAITAIFLVIRYRKGWHVKSRRSSALVKPKYAIKRMRLGTLGRWSQLRTFLQLVSVARRGKPAVFIVQPMKA